MSKQLQMDFARGDQLGLLASAPIPAVGKGKNRVSASTLRHVLRVIDDYARGGECWAAECTIADRCGLSVRTVRRAVAGLFQLSLICVERKPRGAAYVNHYRIVWSELAVLENRAPVTSAPVAKRESNASLARQRVAAGVHGEEAAASSEEDAASNEEDDNYREEAAASSKAYEPTMKRPNRPRNQAAAGLEQKEKTRLLQEVGLRTAASLVSELGDSLTLQEVQRVVDEFRMNTKLFRSPGAIVERLRLGCWPADGVRTTDDRERELQRKTKNRSASYEESLRVRIVRSGRAAGASQAEIDRRIELATQALRESLKGEKDAS